MSGDNITRTYWTAKKAVGGAALNNIQEVQIQSGRRRITDLLTAGTATVRGRRPDLLPSLLIGDTINLTLYAPYPNQPGPGDYDMGFSYRVADLTIEYGEVSAMDTWTLELEDAIAYLGRASLSTTTIASGTSTATAANTIATAAGLSQTTTAGTTTTTSGQTVTGQNALEVYQILANTEAAWINCDGDNMYWRPRNSWQSQVTFYDFTDNGTSATITYTDYRTASLAENYADKIVVRPRGSSDVITGTGIFSYNLDSYSFDTAQASNLASFWQAALDVDYVTPRQISYMLNGNYATALNVVGQSALHGATVTFRGTTTSNIITGFQIYGSLDATYVTLYLSATNFLNFLVLDDAIYGKLDSNRLGWG